MAFQPTMEAQSIFIGQQVKLSSPLEEQNCLKTRLEPIGLTVLEFPQPDFCNLNLALFIN